MSTANKNINKEISAEMLLNYLYPDRMDQWTVNDRGTFYRNYSCDIMDMNLQQDSVSLARDGLFRLLPEGFFVNRQSQEKESKEEENWRLMLLHEAFSPLDTLEFRTQLQLEREVDSVLRYEWEFMNSRLFMLPSPGADYAEAYNLLPLVRNRKGNLLYIKMLLSSLCECPVNMDCSHRHSHSDSTVRWMPKVRYELLIPDLTAEEYRKLQCKIQPLVEFIQEWLVPFDVKCEIAIKQHGCEPVPGEGLILGYNSEL